MAMEIPIAEGLATVSVEEAGMRFVVRQPILDGKGVVQAYALLFRGGLEKAVRESLETPTSTVMDHAFVFGLEALTRGLPAFVTCTGESLTSGIVHLLPASLTVLELQDGAQPTPELIAACHFL
jgi:c-di-GMP-related signal transduction protein